MKGVKQVIHPGTRFTRVVVLREVPSHNRVRYLLCRCDCGKVWEVQVRNLVRGDTKSCGCLRRERFIEREGPQHGESGTPLYNVWVNMRQRCARKSHPSYEHYGGRGIRVCRAWQKYEAFRDWARESGYAAGLTIERIDVHGGYNAENCTWIPQSEQSNNTRRTLHLTYKGKTMTAKEWAEARGLNRATLYGRLRKGWPIERVLAPAEAARR